GRSSYARAMIELKANAELKDTIVRNVNPGLGVAKNMKKTTQAPKGFSVGSKIGFKPAKECRHVSKKPTANGSGNKKNDVEPTNKVSNSNPFDVLNSVENDLDLGTNGGTSNSASKEPNSSGSLFWNVESCSMSTTPIVEKIRKIENLIRDERVNLVDDEGIQRISLTGFPAQSVGSSNTDVLDSPCLLVLITGTSQSRQHVITSLIHIESCKSPTKSLFDVGSSRISIFTVNT
ncbi:hypothetical protein Tco_1461584, partial [Tanacetum coccineum]